MFLQDSVDVKSRGFLDFGFLCVTLVFPICRNSSKIGFGKKLRLCQNLQCFLRCVRAVGGGDHIYIYIHTCFLVWDFLLGAGRGVYSYLKNQMHHTLQILDNILYYSPNMV